MTRSIELMILLTTLMTASAVAGTIEGKASLGNSVIYVDTIQGKTFLPPSQRPVMGQQKLAFNPHILVVQQGTTVEFLNNDAVQHNVFWPSISGIKKEGHNLGTWPKGDKRSFNFDRPGVVALLCNVHPEMSGYIIVSPTPYFSESDAEGNYKIDNVPDGRYNVVAWHEGAKQQTKSVEVVGSGKVDFTLSK
jgi:plastocyanin